MKDPLIAAMERAVERGKVADAIYEALRSTGRLPRQRALTYRCRNRARCLLLEVIPTPEGLLFHTPEYKLSRKLNEASSSESGRAKNTVDGQRHWRGHSFFEESAGNCPVNCDHVRDAIELADVREDLTSGLKEITIPR